MVITALPVLLLLTSLNNLRNKILLAFFPSELLLVRHYSLSLSAVSFSTRIHLLKQKCLSNSFAINTKY
jgi:hypothetical protein